MNGQGEPRFPLRYLCGLLIVAAGLAYASVGASADRITPSGLPVPRYVSLKFQTVNARGGPGDDHRLLWVYHARGLPVQVVAENSEWRRVCDPEGGLAWVHKRTTDSPRTVISLQAEPLTLRKSPKANAPAAAYLRPRAIAELVRCDQKGWCKFRVGGVSGWGQASEVWGLDERPQCSAAPAPVAQSTAVTAKAQR